MPRERLPIHDLKDEILGKLGSPGRLIVQAPTGAGKSTQIPQFILDSGAAGPGQIIVLQPRRLPARMLAKRVAEERGVDLGGEVGYQIRFENRTSAATRIAYITEGVLLRRMLAHPALDGVACVIFDEFHERHLYGDISLALAFELQKSRRPDLTIAVMSATLSTAQVETYLQPAAVASSEGRAYPVAIEYLDKPLGARENEWDAAVAAFGRLARQGLEGDVLIFMPGVFEIQKTIAALQASPAAKGCVLLPLHGELPPREQDAALARHPARKIVVTTNVAETSLTIDGVTAVIDSGLARLPRFDPRRGINTLWIERIGRSSADQRAGRAGRTAPGRCIRLWTEREHDGRPPFELPEIKRIDLTEVVLTLKALGVADCATFPWFEPPDERALEHAERLLADLGAAAPETGLITETGRRMLSFPVHPRYARMLLEAGELGCGRDVALIAALTQERELFARGSDRRAGAARRSFVEAGDRSDFFPLMRAWDQVARRRFAAEACAASGINPGTARRVGELRDQFLRIAEAEGLKRAASNRDEAALRRSIFAGFSDQLARRKSAGSLTCALVHARRGTLDRETCLGDDDLFVAAEINEIEGGSGKGSVRLSLATAVEPAWLEEVFPGDCRASEEISYDTTRNRVVIARQRWFRDLELARTTSPDVPLDAAATLLAGEILRGKLELPAWDEQVEQWMQRVNCLAAWCPEEGIGPFRDEDKRAVLEQICWGSTSKNEIEEKKALPVLKAWYNPAQQERIDRLAPERLRLPNGRSVKITYREGAPPTLAARIQDLYDVKGTLTIAGGKVRLLIQVLAPNHRPVQVTEDLSTFWKVDYPRIKQQLKQRYSKHEWR